MVRVWYVNVAFLLGKTSLLKLRIALQDWKLCHLVARARFLGQEQGRGRRNDRGSGVGGCFLGALCGRATRQKGEGPLRESLIGEEFELSSREHAGRKIMHVGGLKVEVPKHSIGLPPTNQLD
jgi:hypothetical protein